jgi:hypothetical protein
MLVNRAQADGAPTGQGHPGAPKAGQKRRQHVDRSPHGFNQFIGRGLFGKIRGVNAQDIFPDTGRCPQHLQHLDHGPDVANVGNIGNFTGAFREQTRGHNGQGSIFRAANADGALQPAPAF